LEDSRNGYSITAKAPREADAAIKHYVDMLRRYTLDFPEEWALCHFSLGKIFACDFRPSEDRSRQLENAIFHFKTASQVLTAESFPAMWALSCLIQAALYREKASLIYNREFSTVKRLNALPTAQVGVEMAEEALAFFVVQPHRFVMEHAFCRLYMGWLLILCGELNSDNINTFTYTTLLERGISHIEKGHSLLDKLLRAEEAAKAGRGDTTLAPLRPTDGGTDGGADGGAKGVRWSNLSENKDSSPGSASIIKRNLSSVSGVSGTPSPSSDLDFTVPFHPHHHRRVLLNRKPLLHYSGVCHALLGQAYFGLCTEGDPASSRDTLYMAYENLTDSLKPKYGLKDSVLWVESRFLLASVVMKDPTVLDDSGGGPVGVDFSSADTWGDTGSGPVGLTPIKVVGRKSGKSVGTLPPANAALPAPPDNNVAIEVCCLPRLLSLDIC
jgi:hypothetical protein